MELLRKQDLSVIYWLRDLLIDSPFIDVVSEYTTDSLIPPCIAVETGSTDGEPFELGNREVLIQRMYYIDVYAQNISQRNDYAYKIFNELTTSVIPIYDYDEGFPPDVSPTQLGTLKFVKARIDPITLDPELVDQMKYRSAIMYSAIYVSKT
jgi:hypothetical protein